MLTDEDLQQALAAAFHEEADPVARTVIEPPTLLRQGIRRRRTAVRAGSLVAAAAVAVVSLVTVAGGPAGGPVTAGGQTGLLLAAAVSPAPPAAAAARGMPPFYLVADHSQPVADVRESATGRLVSQVRLPAGTDPKLTQVSATANDRAFVLAVFSLPAGTRFYELQISAGGQPAGLTPLPVSPLPAGEIADDIALTPDGTRLAVASQHAGAEGAIEVITLATGATRTWTTSHSGIPEELSWDATGQRLAYFWTSDSASLAGLWLLDTGAPGSALLSGQRLLPQTVGPDTVQSALLTPDARAIIASVTYNGTAHVGAGAVVGGVVEVSARTGRPLRTLLAERAAHSRDAGWFITGCELPSIDHTGNHLLVSCDPFGRLDRGRFTRLPGAAPHTAVTAAW